MKKLKKKVLIFDVDGVIFDSKENMLLSWSQVQNKFNIHKIPFKNYFKHIGRPFNLILKRIGIKNNYKKIYRFYKYNSIKYNSAIKYYPNTLNILKKLHQKKFQLCIVTSKDSSRTKKFLGTNTKYFTQIKCHKDTIKGKPHPNMLNSIIKKLNVNKKDCIYIGDTHIDYLTAKNAGIDFMFAMWGYGKNYNYKHKSKSILELEKIFKVI